MTVRIKDWSKFQHFKDRRPPWVKLYRDLLDDIEWFELDPEAAKALVMLWLIASETEGQLPDVKKLSFRLRLSEKDVNRVISKLSHWLEHDDIKPISERCHTDDETIPLARSRETETEKRRGETEGVRAGFDEFWASYPKRRSRGQAEKAWDKLNPSLETVQEILQAVEVARASDDWQREGGRFIPHPGTWLNAKGWMDSQEVNGHQATEWWARAGFGSKEAAQRSGIMEPA